MIKASFQRLVARNPVLNFNPCACILAKGKAYGVYYVQAHYVW